MTRRGSGEGSIRERSDGRWEARYRAADGRRRSVFGRTRRDAQDRLRAALQQRDRGARPVDQRVTVAGFLEDWLDHEVRPSRRPRTLESYSGIVHLYLIPELGRIPLAKLQPEDVQRMLARLTGRRGALSPTTRRYVYAVLRIALGRALKLGRVERNVCTLIDPPSKPRRELQPLSGSELRSLLDGTRGDRLGALYVTAAGTGLRQGELLALRWSDLELDRGELAVRHTLQRGTRTLGEPKTERGRRALRLPHEVRTALRDHRRRQLAERLAAGSRWSDADLVFTTAIGTALDSRNVTRYLQRHLDRLGLPRQRFHDLRHAFATLMIEAGEDLGVVSRILGHAELATTANVYAHLTPAMRDRVAERMDAILRASS
ncbi:MAG: site-specific integrase [Chloroflexi bacterium]|nr:MAG: site-specific integrase [Chloroflexota bacterium]